MRRLIGLLTLFVAVDAYASGCPSGDELLTRNTPISQLCAGGYTGVGGDSIESAMRKRQDNVSMIYASAQDNGIPPDLALAVSYHESAGFQSCARSPTGVVGPMMLTKTTARSYGYDRDINEQNIKGGMAVLGAAYKKCGYDYGCLASRYNGSTPAEQAQWARGVQAANQKLKNNPVLVASACGQQTTESCTPSDIGNPSLPGTSVAQVPTVLSSDGISAATNPPTASMASVVISRG